MVRRRRRGDVTPPSSSRPFLPSLGGDPLVVDFPPQPTFQLRLFLRMEKMKDVIVRHVSEPVIATRIIIIIIIPFFFSISFLVRGPRSSRRLVSLCRLLLIPSLRSTVRLFSTILLFFFIFFFSFVVVDREPDPPAFLLTDEVAFSVALGLRLLAVVPSLLRLVAPLRDGGLDHRLTRGLGGTLLLHEKGARCR